LGQLNNVLSEILVDINEMIEYVHSAFKIREAKGEQLDHLGDLKGIPRLKQTFAQGSQIFTGNLGYVVPAGTIVENSTTSRRFSTQSSFDLSLNSLVEVWISVNTQDDTTYNLIAGGDTFTYTSGTGATDASIISGIASAINSNLDTELEVEDLGSSLRIYSPSYTPFSTVAGEGVFAEKGSVLAYVYATETGDDSSGINSVTKLVFGNINLEATYNPFSMIAGQDAEEDEDYRVRLLSPAAIEGNATVPAIAGKVRAIEGVSYALVEHNPTSEQVGDLLPYNTHVIVQGGSDQDIVETLFYVVGAGGPLYGNTEIPYVYEGQSYPMRFSRPSGNFMAIRVTYSRYEEEEFDSLNASDNIRSIVESHINDLGIGVDIIPGRVESALYRGLSGLGDITVEVQDIPSAGAVTDGVWQSNTMPIASTEFAQTSLVDIYISEV